MGRPCSCNCQPFTQPSQSTGSSTASSSFPLVSNSFSGYCDVCPTLPTSWAVTQVSGSPYAPCACHEPDGMPGMTLFWTSSRFSYLVEWYKVVTSFDFSEFVCDVWRSDEKANLYTCTGPGYSEATHPECFPCGTHPVWPRCELVLFRGATPSVGRWSLAYFYAHPTQPESVAYGALAHEATFEEDGTTCLSEKTFNLFTGSFYFPCPVLSATVTPS